MILRGCGFHIKLSQHVLDTSQADRLFDAHQERLVGKLGVVRVAASAVQY